MNLSQRTSEIWIKCMIWWFTQTRPSLCQGWSIRPGPSPSWHLAASDSDGGERPVVYIRARGSVLTQQGGHKPCHCQLVSNEWIWNIVKVTLIVYLFLWWNLHFLVNLDVGPSNSCFWDPKPCDVEITWSHALSIFGILFCMWILNCIIISNLGTK